MKKRNQDDKSELLRSLSRLTHILTRISHGGHLVALMDLSDAVDALEPNTPDLLANIASIIKKLGDIQKSIAREHGGAL